MNYISKVQFLISNIPNLVFRIHDKIVDVLTESMVALYETVSNLEEKCDDIKVPDDLKTIDLVDKYMTLEVV